MKTLDEVIRANECCDHGEPDSRCEDCPYNGIGACCLERESDALHYLKELRNITDIPMEYFKSSGTLQISCPKCHIEFVILPESNNALTWEELKQMEGKPIWVETDDNEKFWTIVDNFRIICNQECLCCSKGYMCRSTYTRGDWQAYREEH